MHWLLLLEEYACEYHYKEGPKNVVADTLSCVPTSCTEMETPSIPSVLPPVHNPSGDLLDAESSCLLLEQPVLYECLLEFPTFDPQDMGKTPLQFDYLRTLQQWSDKTKALLGQNEYKLKRFGTSDLICHVTDTGPKIVMSNEMLPR